MTALLSIQQLCVKLQDKQVISSLDLTLDEGDILGLVGASGCGKTTLLNAIAGFNKPSHGNIQLKDKELCSIDKNLPAEQRQVGMIFQDYALFPHLSVKENIAFGISKLSKKDQKEQIDNLLNTLKLSDLGDSYIHQLSGGQQQRVAIARALAPRPRLLLLDEPFSNIDARLRNELMVEIRQLLKQFKMTAIFVTHNKDEVFTFADKMAVMAEGKILQLAAPGVICQQPNSYQVADFLQLGSWLPCKINSSCVTSLLGQLPIKPSDIKTLDKDQDKITYLLMKPLQLSLSTAEEDHSKANAQVEYISVTEQGYHYHLRSLAPYCSNTSDTCVINNELAFTKLSLYSDLVLTMNQQVVVNVKPHDYLFFN